MICHALLVSAKPYFCPQLVSKHLESKCWLTTLIFVNHIRLHLSRNIRYLTIDWHCETMFSLLTLGFETWLCISFEKNQKTTGFFVKFFHSLFCFNCSLSHVFCMSKVPFMLPVHKSFTFSDMTIMQFHSQCANGMLLEC